MTKCNPCTCDSCENEAIALENEAASLRQEVGRLKTALDRCREQRNEFFYDASVVPYNDIQDADAEIQSILAGGEGT